MYLVVLHQGAIGDFVLALSVIQAMRASLSADRVTAIASAPSARLASGRSAVDISESPEVFGLHRLFSTESLLDDRLASLLSTADCVLSFLGDASGPVHRRLCDAAAGQVVSIDPRPSRETRTKRRHITSQWTNAVRQGGLDIGDPRPPVIRLGRPSTQVGHGPTSSHTDRVIIHPGSGGGGKCWPIKRFIALAESRVDADVAWMLGPTEQETADALVATVRDRVAAGRESLIVEDDFESAARQIADADLFIGNDAGMTHVAAALGVPTRVIFSTTDPRVWRPLGDHVQVVYSN